jgi:hypothetical protein
MIPALLCCLYLLGVAVCKAAVFNVLSQMCIKNFENTRTLLRELNVKCCIMLSKSSRRVIVRSRKGGAGEIECHVLLPKAMEERHVTQQMPEYNLGSYHHKPEIK